MKKRTKRTSCRNSMEINIKYTTGNPDMRKPGKIRNSRSAGMCLETNKSVTPGTRITIKKQRPHVQEIYQAIVKWCHANPLATEFDFNIGIQYQIKTYPVINGQTVAGVIPQCDLCTESINSGQIHIIKNSLYLCSSCLSYINSLDKMTRESIEHFLIGNIL